MPISLLTSPPGTGKTLKAVSIILEKLKEGYVVYSNIIGLNVPGVLPLEFNADWRDLDDFKRSFPHLEDKPIFVVVDECHEWFVFGSQFNRTKIKEIQDIAEDNKKTQFKLLKAAKQKFLDCLAIVRKEDKRIVSDDEVEEPYFTSCEDYSVYEEQRSALSMHRHFGFDFLLVTQEVSKLNKTVRDFVSIHMHMIRPFGLPYATVFHFREAQDNLGVLTYSRAEHKERFRYPKYLFDLYISTNINSIKSRIPKKLLALIFGLLLFIFYIFYSMYGSYKNHTEPKKDSFSLFQTSQKQQATPTPVANLPNLNIQSGSFDSVQQVEYKRPAMIIESSDDCKVFNTYGERIVVDKNTCKNMNSKASNLSFSKIDYSSKHSHFSESSNNSDTTLLSNDSKTYKSSMQM